MKNTQKNRILPTLHLAEERGYNLTLEQLSKKLIGGPISSNTLKDIIKQSHAIESDGVFFATKTHLYSEKCQQRRLSHKTLQPKYAKIVNKFIQEYTQICPWTTCILLSGSMASEGLGYGDDIDLDIIVHDGFKYSSYLIALLLSLKYSLIYGKHFWKRYVICINIVWETHQVLPFIRNDGQLAFELLNTQVLYNPEFFYYMLTMNPWLNSYFPQLFRSDISNDHFKQSPIITEQKKLHSHLIEYISKNIIFILIQTATATFFQDHDIQKKMAVKHPYALFDVPEKP
jgi:hypothetical protein